LAESAAAIGMAGSAQRSDPLDQGFREALLLLDLLLILAELRLHRDRCLHHGLCIDVCW